MKKTHIFRLAITCLFLHSCTLNQKDDKLEPNYTRNYNNKEIQASTFLSNNNYLNYLDTAKWYLYNYYCDIKTGYLINNDSNYKIPKDKKDQYLSTLDLKIIEARIDTASKNLYLGGFFFINDSTILIGNLGNNEGFLPDGVLIDLNKQAFSSYISENMTIKKARFDSKNYESFTPSVRKFVDSNLNLLNPKYLDILKRMKVLK